MRRSLTKIFYYYELLIASQQSSTGELTLDGPYYTGD